MCTLLPSRVYIFNPSYHRTNLISKLNFTTPRLPSPSTSEFIYSYTKHHVLVKPSSYDVLCCRCNPNLNLWHITPHKQVRKILCHSLTVLLICLFVVTGDLPQKTALASPLHSGFFEGRRKEKKKVIEELEGIVKERMSKGEIMSALEYVKRLSVIQPDEIEWNLLEARCHELMGDLYTAKRMFREILKEQPLSLRALHGLAMVMHKSHQGTAVIHMLEKAVEHARENECASEERGIRILIAHIHVLQRNLEDGLRVCDILVDEDPEDYRPYLCRGIIYGLLERRKEAEEQLDMYRRLLPKDLPKNGFMEEAVLAAEAKANAGMKFKQKPKQRF